MVKKWISGLHLRKGVLHKRLGVGQGKRIPMKLLNKIISAKAGETIKNPTDVGRKRIKVTRLIEERAILARNLKRIRR